MSTNDDLRIIQYLGNKIKVADEIKEVIYKLSNTGETIVDIFSGTGIVGDILQTDYRIISNDIQEYSFLLNKVLLDDFDLTILTEYDINSLYQSQAFKDNFDELSSRFRKQLEYEKKILESENIKKLVDLNEADIFYNGTNMCLNEEINNIYKDVLELYSDKNINEYQENNNKFPYILFSLYYSNGYFSLAQTIEIDSLRYAIDSLSDKAYYEDPQKIVLLASLMHAISEIVSSVGKHFAQPIKTINRNNNIKSFAANRCLRDRKRELKSYFVRMYDKIIKEKKYGNYKNKIFNLEYNQLLDKLNENVNEIDVFYLDPPYTIDHYSRFYHIPETLVKYDYPDLDFRNYKGKSILMNGRYRSDRFQSNFCIKSKVESEFRNIISRIKNEFDSKIVLSYSENDSNKNSRNRVIDKESLIEIINDYYDNVEIKYFDYNYRKLNKQENNIENANENELLIICS